MFVVPIANEAGSAGKTTTAVTLGAELAADGLRVVVIDLDTQANASHWLGGAQAGRPTIADVLMRRAPLADALLPTALSSLHLVAAEKETLGAASVELGRVTAGEQRLRLALNVDQVADVVLVDCPGSLSVLTIAALVASTGPLVTVTQPTVKEQAGIASLERTVEDVAAGYNPALALGAIVPCIVPPANAGLIYGEALALLREVYDDLVTPAVRRSARVAEAYARQLPLPVHAPREGVTEDYRAVRRDLGEKKVLPA